MSMPKIGASATAIEQKNEKYCGQPSIRQLLRSIFIYLRYDPIIDKRSYTALRRGISYIRQARQIKGYPSPYQPQHGFGKAAESLNPQQSR